MKKYYPKLLRLILLTLLTIFILFCFYKVSRPNYQINITYNEKLDNSNFNNISNISSKNLQESFKNISIMLRSFAVKYPVSITNEYTNKGFIVLYTSANPNFLKSILDDFDNNDSECDELNMNKFLCPYISKNDTYTLLVLNNINFQIGEIKSISVKNKHLILSFILLFLGLFLVFKRID